MSLPTLAAPDQEHQLPPANGSDSSIDGYLSTRFGHSFARKPEGTVRIGYINLGGIKSHLSSQDSQLYKFLSDNQVDIICLSELNLHWRLVPSSQQLRECLRGWWNRLHISLGYFQSYPCNSTEQYGGECNLVMGDQASRVTGKGSDRKMGRWTWTTLRGRNNSIVRVISAYRPVRNARGSSSVWNQQLSWIHEKGLDTNPHKLFHSDLLQALKKWLDEGDQIWLGIDINDSAISGAFATSLKDLGLVNLIETHHGSNIPHSCSRGAVSNDPIDSIFVSSTLRDGRSGMLSFDESPSDNHRVLWHDISEASLFGHSLHQQVIPSKRRLQTRDPRVMRKYLDAYKKFCDQHKIIERASILHARTLQPHYSWTDNDTLEWEAIDALRVQGMKAAEKSCRHLYCGAVPWSPELHLASMRIRLWLLLIRKLSGRKVDTKYLRRVAKKAANAVPVTASTTLRQAEQQLLEAKQHYKLIKVTAKQRRVTHLQGLALARAAEGWEAEATAVATLTQRERQREQWSLIRRTLGTGRSGGITQITAPDPDNPGSRRQFTEKADIENACHRENERRFNQASDTPFLVEPLLSAVGPIGLSAGGQHISVQGTLPEGIPPQDVDGYARELCYHFRRPSILGERHWFPTTDEYINGWRKNREATSSGTSGLHFGHFIANTYNDDIAQMDRDMSVMPTQWGFSPTRWQVGINVMLEKKKGNFNVEKLRTILLYEADFNQTNKWLGRQAMWYAERDNLLAWEQYGSRKKKSAIDQLLNKRLTFDLLRQHRKDGAMVSNDAKSCYDRIVHSVAALSLKRIGVPDEAIFCMFSTIQQLSHHIRTAYGDSSSSFSGKLWAVPIQGVGQGNGAGPQIWALVSTVVLSMMQSLGHGVAFRASLSGDKVGFVGYSFVDDTDLCITSEPNEDTVTKMQACTDDWEGGIRATGGAIVPEKSHWYLVQFTWEQGRWRYATINSSPGSLTVRGPDGSRHQLERLETNVARRTLGVRLAPDGNNEAEFNYLLACSREWRDKVRANRLPKKFIWDSMTMGIMKKLCYPLAATTFSEDECTQLIRPILEAGLPASGINRHMARAVVHGPVELQGLGIPNLYQTQITSHISKLLRFGHVSNDMTGQLMRASIQALTLEVGLPGNLFQHNPAPFSSVATHCWVFHIWKELYSHDLLLQTDLPSLQPQRKNDVFLTQHFLAQGYDGPALAALNRCRLFLQVTTLSDCSTTCGSFLLDNILNGEINSLAPQRYSWPAQQRPPESDWHMWRGALRTLLNPYEGTRLSRPLGEWLSPPSEWQWFFCPALDRVYSREDTAWHPHGITRPSSTRNASMQFHRSPSSTPEVKPAFPLHRCLPIYSRHGIRIDRYDKAPAVLLDDEKNPTSFRDTLNAQPSSVKWAYERLECRRGTFSGLWQELKEGTVRAVSDGSYKDGHGTSCWTYAGDRNEVIGYNVCPGLPSDQCSYRSETAGLLAIIYFGTALADYFGPEETISIPVGCDGLYALNKVMDVRAHLDWRASHVDLMISARRHQLKFPNIQWQGHHVKGHQDETGGPLDIWAKLNISMDIGAKAFWRQTCSRPSEFLTQHVHLEPWSIAQGGHKWCQNIPELLHDHFAGKNIKQHWHKRRFPSSSNPSVDWDALGAAVRELEPPRRRWLSKHVSGFVGSGQMMHRMGLRESSDCPSCGRTETATHIWTCPGHAAQSLWATAIDNLDTYMIQLQTMPALREAITQRLLEWSSNTPTQPISEFPYPSLLQAQDLQGWQSAFEGCWHPEWALRQQHYYRVIGSWQTGKRWLTRIILKLWLTAWDLWEQRNGLLHDKTSRLKDEKLNADIRREFSLGFQGFPRSAIPQTQISAQQLLTFRTGQKHMWLRHIRAARRYSQRSKKEREILLQRQFMENYFGVSSGKRQSST